MSSHVTRMARWVPVALVSAIVLALAVSVVTAGPSPSCALAAPGSIEESDSFTPAAAQRGPVQTPLRRSELPEAEGAVDELVPNAEIDRLSLRLVLQNGDSLYRYFLDRPIPETMTPDEFWAAGGLQLEKDPAEGDFAAYLLAELGDRAVPIQIGPYQAAPTWADPTRSGVRTHNLYWSDGESNYALIAVRSPEAIVNLARELVCDT